MIFLRRSLSLLLGENPIYLQAWSFLRMQMQIRLKVGNWQDYKAAEGLLYNPNCIRNF